MGDTAAEQDNPTSLPSTDESDADTTASDGTASVTSESEPTGAPAEKSAEPEHAASGIIPPVPDGIEQTTFAPGPQFGPDGFAPPEQGGFAPGPFAPPGANPYPPNQGFAPPGFPMNDHSGPFAPPGDPNGFPPPWAGGPGPEGFAPSGFPGEQGFAPSGFPGEQGFAPPGAPADQGGFPPPGHPGEPGFAPAAFPGEQGGFPPPGNPGEPGGFAPGGFPGEQNGFAPPGEHGGFPPHGNPGEPGGFAPHGNPGDPGGFAAQGNPGEHGGFRSGAGEPGYGEVRQETPYGEIRQEIGADGMVRRVFDDRQGPPSGPEQQGADADAGGQIFSWAPPPLPSTPPQQPQQYQPQQQGGWQGGPGPQQHLPQGYQQQPQSTFQPQHMTQPVQPGNSVNDLNLLKRARRSPRSGWRRAVHKVTGGAINPGESSADVIYRELVDRVNQPVRGDYRIAILSLKGGVGKTTTTVGLGSTFASLRGDRVIAIDANPDLGTLAHRVPRQTRSTVRNLLEDQHISRYSDVRAHTSQAPSRLEVLASEQDPAVSEAFSEADYRRAIGILQQFYNIILTDCGTGLMHSAMAGVLDMASSLILVTSPAIDGARSASATLDWLEHHGYSKLVERTVVVVNASRRGASTVDLDQLRKLFLDRTRAVQVVPFDDHLAEGAEIDLELVSKPTRRALLELAAMVADDFGYHVPQPPFPGPQTQYPGPQSHYPGPQGY
ncbi:Flp pilus assembly protein, ATPase CpaE [Nocardia africana]|uniref:Flp pilus assembly protein, ATPase CpaE n=2 Tax=Nocardia africana TaxID=134964 RepID=A0A378WIZ1_9NOCA|nr:Flp pilus assembly protein, ATPase CpaE [Nocardia africana]